MKKRILSVVLTVVMLLALVPVSAFAAGTALPAPVTNSSGKKVITLTQDITLSENVSLLKANVDYITVSGNVTLKGDADGAKITADNIEDLFQVTAGNTLTLGENLTIVTTESILYANGGTINIDGATLKSTHTSHALGFAANSGVINVNSGAIDSYWTALTASGANSKINVSGGSVVNSATNLVLARDGAIATISGGTLTTGDYAALWAYKKNTANGGKFVITGGTITGANSVSLEGNSEAEISGGNFNGSVALKENCELEISDGNFSDIVFTTDTATGASINISGGTFAGKIENRNANATIEITGGTFATDVTDFLVGNINQNQNGVIGTVHTITMVNGTASADESVFGNVICIDADDIIGGKQFMYWEVKTADGRPVQFIGGKANEISSFIMPDCDITVTAVYRAVLPMFMHSIIVVDSDYGTTSPTGIMLVMQGLSHKFTFTPDEGCEIVDVLINGESVGAVDSYRLTVNEFVNTVEAIYAPIVEGDAE